MHDGNARARLEAWRRAVRERDALARDGEAWRAADAEVAAAARAFHAEVAQASARHAEGERAEHERHWGHLPARSPLEARD